MPVVLSTSTVYECSVHLEPAEVGDRACGCDNVCDSVTTTHANTLPLQPRTFTLLVHPRSRPLVAAYFSFTNITVN